MAKGEIDKELKPFQLAFTGRWRPAISAIKLTPGDMQILTNMHYTMAPGIKAVFGMSKINSTPLGD